MDDESAEIELLEQNLNKTRQISQRMISILSGFDSRLVKLERSIQPLYASTQDLNRRASNIDKALLKIDEVAGNYEGTAAEEALILRGPQLGQLQVYTDALQHLNASIAFKASSDNLRETGRLVDTGAKKLTQLYTKLVAEASSDSADLTPGPEILTPLRSLVSSIRTLPLPATHPSHPAAASIQTTVNEAQRGYAEMRGNWVRKVHAGRSRRILDRAQREQDGISVGQEFGQWVEGLLSTAEIEYNLLLDLAPLPNPGLLPSTYNILLAPLLALFSETLASLVGFVKGSLRSYTFLALSTHTTLTNLQPSWDSVMAQREVQRETDELKDGLRTLKAVCLRVFPEVLADVKMAASTRDGELNTEVADFVVSTIQFIERLPEVQEAVASALLTLGDGNWKMGEGVKLGKPSGLGENAGAIVTEHYLYDLITTMISSLGTLSKTQRQPAFGAIFLLNNIAYLRLRLLSRSSNPGMSSFLVRPTQEVIQSNFRTAKAGYFDSNFSPLMQALVEDPRERANRAATKERFTRFFDLLEEVAERHRIAKVLLDDPDSREAVVEEVVKLVVPSLQRFTQKNREKEFSKNPQKYIKLSPEEVETQIRNFYR